MHYTKDDNSFISNFKKLLTKSVQIGKNIEIRIPICLILLITLGLLYGNLFTFDNDNFFQLAHAKVLFSQGFVKEEPLTMHTGLDFLIPQWLSIVFIYLTYTYGGVVLLNLFFYIFVFSTIVIMYKTAMLILNGDSLKSVVWTSVETLFFMLIGYTTRPHVISLFFIALEIYVLEQYKHGKEKYIWCLPFISVMIINFHNSLWLFFVLVGIAYLAEFMIYKTGPEKIPRNTVIASMLSLVVSLMNPYGIDGVTYIFNSLKSIQPIASYIIELMPIGIRMETLMWLAHPFLIILLLLYRKSNKKIPLRYVFLWLGTLLLMIQHVRSSIQYFVCSFPIFLIAVNEIDTEVVPFRKKDLVESLVVLLLVFPIYSRRPNMDNNDDTDFMKYIEENIPRDAVIFNHVNNGGMLELNEYKPYIDARLEVFGKDNNKKFDYLSEYVSTLRGADIEEILEKYDFEYIILALVTNDTDAMENYAKKSEAWEEIYRSENSVIFQRIQ